MKCEIVHQSESVSQVSFCLLITITFLASHNPTPQCFACTKSALRHTDHWTVSLACSFGFGSSGTVTPPWPSPSCSNQLICSLLIGFVFLKMKQKYLSTKDGLMCLIRVPKNIVLYNLKFVSINPLSLMTLLPSKMLTVSPCLFSVHFSVCFHTEKHELWFTWFFFFKFQKHLLKFSQPIRAFTSTLVLLLNKHLACKGVLIASSGLCRPCRSFLFLMAEVLCWIFCLGFYPRFLSRDKQSFRDHCCDRVQQWGHNLVLSQWLNETHLNKKIIHKKT